jgi:Zn-dependent protease with chaperone function
VKNKNSKDFNEKYILGRSSLSFFDCFACIFLSYGILLVLFSILLLPFISLAVNTPLLAVVVFLLITCSPIIIILILKMSEWKNKHYLSQYEVAREIESFKVLLTFNGTIPIFGFGFFVFIANAVDIFFNGRNVPPSLILYLLLAIPITTIFFFYILYKMFKLYRAAKNLRGLEVLKGEFKDMIDQRLKNIVENLPLKDEKDRLKSCVPKYLIEKDNFGATPSMIVSSGYPNIIFPLGYFKVIKSNPEAADAMLAHEMAHYLHKDSNFLLWVRCYYNSIHKLTYIILINIAIRLLIDSSLFIPLSFFALLSYLIQELLLLFLRRRVEFAEELADVFAAIAVSPLAVNQFLRDYVENNDDNSVNEADRESLHPPVSRRLQISEYLNRSIEKSLSLPN